MKTYLDAGVLILAFRGPNVDRIQALTLLDETNRVFVSSPFLKLELLPKAIYHRQPQELQLYQEFFDLVQIWATDTDLLVKTAYDLASQYGLASMDALHVAAALSVGADELITTEKKTKPMHRVVEIRVVSLVD